MIMSALSNIFTAAWDSVDTSLATDGNSIVQGGVWHIDQDRYRLDFCDGGCAGYDVERVVDGD